MTPPPNPPPAPAQQHTGWLASTWAASPADAPVEHWKDLPAPPRVSTPLSAPGAPLYFADVLEEFLEELNALQADFYHRAASTSPLAPRPARDTAPTTDAEILCGGPGRAGSAGWGHVSRV